MKEQPDTRPTMDAGRLAQVMQGLRPSGEAPVPPWKRPEEVAKTKAAKAARPKRSLGKGLILRVGRDLRPFFNRVVGRYSLVGDAPVLPRESFPWAAELEANWRTIRGELESLLSHFAELPAINDISPDHRRISGDHWKSVFLYGYGHRRERSCRRCPETARLLDRIPELETALFSILEPGAFIKPHRGPTRAYITCHLGLIVPEPRARCFIEVDGKPYLWEEGRTLFFDDTYKHAVWNDTDGFRAVLLLHLRRPVAFPGSLLNRLFLAAIKMSPFVRDGIRNQEAWERRFEEIAGPTPVEPPR